MRIERRSPGSLYRKWKSIEFLATRDRRATLEFLCDEKRITFLAQLELLRRFISAMNAVRGYHTLAKMLTLARAIIARPHPIVLEAGCGFGASTAKLSLATELTGGSLIACDSFRKISENDKRHESMDERRLEFRPGTFRGTLTSVRRRIETWGAIDVCRFEKGSCEETLPRLDDPLDVVVLDVDFLSSTKTCVENLWPRIRPGGVLFSLDGQLRATHELLAYEGFWREEVGRAPPLVQGFGQDNLLVARRPAVPSAP
jgi:predicted O-methyltransferase YrrM